MAVTLQLLLFTCTSFLESYWKKKQKPQKSRKNGFSIYKSIWVTYTHRRKMAGYGGNQWDKTLK